MQDSLTEASRRRAKDGTLSAMVDQHRKDTGRGITNEELRQMKRKLEPIAESAEKKILENAREKNLKGRKYF